MILEVGDNFNHWTYIGKAEHLNPHYGLFQCDCGEVRAVYSFNVILGKSLSCGNCKHNLRGLSKEDYTALIAARSRAMQRCYNPNFASYLTHGGRGIRVCDEWVDSVDLFVDWALKNGWERGLTLDRIDNDGHYTPDNCRWADWKVQGRNRRTCLYFEHDGEKLCMSEWCERRGIPHYLALNRYKRGETDFNIIFSVEDFRRRDGLSLTANR